MSQERKRILVKTLLGNSNLSVKEISRKIGVSIATVYRIKSRKVNNIGLKHRKGAGRPSILRKSIRRSLANQTKTLSVCAYFGASCTWKTISRNCLACDERSRLL